MIKDNTSSQMIEKRKYDNSKITYKELYNNNGSISIRETYEDGILLTIEKFYNDYKEVEVYELNDDKQSSWLKYEREVNSDGQTTVETRYEKDDVIAVEFSEYEYQDSGLLSEKVYTVEGNLKYIDYYEAGEVSSKQSYYYEDDNLVEIKTVDLLRENEDGSEFVSEDVFLEYNNNVLANKKVYSEGDLVDEYIYNTVDSEPELYKRITYNDIGKQYGVYYYKENENIDWYCFFYYEFDDINKYVVTEIKYYDELNELRKHEEYDWNGNLKQYTLYQKEGDSEVVTLYNKDGSQKEKTVSIIHDTKRTEHVFDGDNVLLSSNIYDVVSGDVLFTEVPYIDDGRVKSVSVINKEGMKTEEKFYDDDEKVYKIYYYDPNEVVEKQKHIEYHSEEGYTDNIKNIKEYDIIDKLVSEIEFNIEGNIVYEITVDDDGNTHKEEYIYGFFPNQETSVGCYIPKYTLNKSVLFPAGTIFIKGYQKGSGSYFPPEILFEDKQIPSGTYLVGGAYIVQNTIIDRDLDVPGLTRFPNGIKLTANDGKVIEIGDDITVHTDVTIPAGTVLGGEDLLPSAPIVYSGNMFDEIGIDVNFPQYSCVFGDYTVEGQKRKGIHVVSISSLSLGKDDFVRGNVFIPAVAKFNADFEIPEGSVLNGIINNSDGSEDSVISPGEKIAMGAEVSEKDFESSVQQIDNSVRNELTRLGKIDSSEEGGLVDNAKDIKSPNPIKTPKPIDHTPKWRPVSLNGLADNEKWSSSEIGGFLNNMQDAIQAMRATLQYVMDILNSLAEVVKSVLSFIQKELNAFTEVVRLAEKTLTEFIDTLTSSGLYVLALPPEQRTVDQVLADFEASFETSSADQERFTPRFKSQDYIMGGSVMLVYPDYKQIMGAFGTFCKAFNLPVQYLSSSGFDAEVNYDTLTGDEGKNDKVVIRWGSSVDFFGWGDIDERHQIEIKYTGQPSNPVATTSGEIYVNDVHEDTVTIENDGENNQNSYELSLRDGYNYVIDVTAYIYNTKIQSYLFYGEKKLKIDIPSEAQYWDNEENLPEADFKGSFTDGRWVVASLDSMFPAIYKLKRNLIRWIHTIADDLVIETTALDKSIGAWISYVQKIMNAFNRLANELQKLLASFQLSLDRIGYYKGTGNKFITGGNAEFIRIMKDKKGIDETYIHKYADLKSDIDDDISKKIKETDVGDDYYTGMVVFLMGGPNVEDLKAKGGLLWNMIQGMLNQHDEQSEALGIKDSLNRVKDATNDAEKAWDADLEEHWKRVDFN